ncbi:hypothetical protein Dda_3466 [Drechslerella dactyloides]|uniref:Uncharacterized protein n=1 Tax=Drechslerella dactyloides TaxID=74499 RepID=A0AAD6J310_DREDA|nr:hypothetical protein Dda_3466 [Drechslerella dactyloides]
MASLPQASKHAMSCFKKTDVVYVNWAPEAPTWDEVICDLVLRMILAVFCLATTTIAIVATPFAELSTGESFVKGVAPFLLIWSLACFCSEETRRETAMITGLVLSQPLASSRSKLHLLRALLTIMTTPVVMFARGVATMKRLLVRDVYSPLSNIWTRLRWYCTSVFTLGGTDNELVVAVQVLLASCLMVYCLAILLAIGVVLYGPSVFDMWVRARYWWTRVVDGVRGQTRGQQPLPDSVTIRRRPRRTTTEKPTAWTSEGLPIYDQPDCQPPFLRGSPSRHSLRGPNVAMSNLWTVQRRVGEWQRRPVPDNQPSRPPSSVPPVCSPPPPPPPSRMPPPRSDSVSALPPQLQLSELQLPLVVSAGSGQELAYVKWGLRYKDRPRSKYHQAPRYDLVRLL